jgi:hypothetical protein
MDCCDSNLSEDAYDIHSKRFNEMLKESNFLAPHENWEEIVAQDAEVLKTYHIKKDQIADCLETLTQKFKTAPDYTNSEIIEKLPNHLNGCDDNLEYKLVDNKFVISISRTKGYHDYPFDRPDDRIFKGGSSDYVIYNLSNNKIIRFGDLLIELIRDHGFFEGSVLYRLDPKEVILTLELIPEQDYKPVYQKVSYWSSVMSSNRIDQLVLKKYDFKRLGNLSVNITDERLRILNPTNVKETITIEGSPVTTSCSRFDTYCEYKRVNRYELI